MLYYWGWQTPDPSPMVRYPGPVPWSLSGVQDILCFRLFLFDKGYHFASYRKLWCANLGLAPEIHDKVRGILMVFFFFRASVIYFFFSLYWKNWDTSFPSSLSELPSSKDTMLLLIQGPSGTILSSLGCPAQRTGRLTHPSGSLF